MPTRSGRTLALLASIGVITVAPGRALAHTELDFSLPANGTTVGDPVSEISVGFTDQVALVGNGFEVHDPQGNLLTPFVVTDDDKVFRFQLDPPLAGGLVVVDYHVRAVDGDVQEGSFSFTAAAPLPTSPTSAPTTTVSPVGTTAPATTQPAGVVDVSTTISAVTTAAATLPGDGSDGDSERTLMFVVLIALAVACAGFLVVRSRRPA
jgi:methionine-rich copper-binding protein CopC